MPILDFLVSSSGKLVLFSMYAIIVQTMHSTSKSQSFSVELDLAVGSFHSMKDVGKSACACLCCSVNLLKASDVVLGIVHGASLVDMCLSLAARSDAFLR
jgi:hypothetical protein